MLIALHSSWEINTFSDPASILDTSDFSLKRINRQDITVPPSEIVLVDQLTEMVTGYKDIQVRLSGLPEFIISYKSPVRVLTSAAYPYDSEYTSVEILLVTNKTRYQVGVLSYKSDIPYRCGNLQVVSFERLGKYLIYTTRYDFMDCGSRIYLILRFVWTETGNFQGVYLLNKTLVTDDLWVFSEIVKSNARLERGCILDKALQAKIELIKEGY